MCLQSGSTTFSRLKGQLINFALSSKTSFYLDAIFSERLIGQIKLWGKNLEPKLSSRFRNEDDLTKHWQELIHLHQAVCRSLSSHSFPRQIVCRLLVLQFVHLHYQLFRWGGFERVKSKWCKDSLYLCLLTAPASSFAKATSPLNGLVRLPIWSQNKNDLDKMATMIWFQNNAGNNKLKVNSHCFFSQLSLCLLAGFFLPSCSSRLDLLSPPFLASCCQQRMQMRRMRAERRKTTFCFLWLSSLTAPHRPPNSRLRNIVSPTIGISFHLMTLIKNLATGVAVLVDSSIRHQVLLKRLQGARCPVLGKDCKWSRYW